MEHLTQQQLEAFVLDLTPPDPERVRRHVAECPACAERLAAECRLEAALREAMGAETAVARVAHRSMPRFRPAVLASAAALLAVAGSVWILAVRERPAPAARPASTPSAVWTPAGNPAASPKGASSPPAPAGAIRVAARAIDSSSERIQVEPASLGAAPAAGARWPDPMHSAPGYDVTSPADLGLHVTIPVGGSIIP